MATTERELHEDVRELLMSGAPFQYAHLIKFERPSIPDAVTGAVSTSYQNYTYITDASRDVSFDDLSVDREGNANGIQTYIANKVLSVGAIQEATEAKADSCNLLLDGNGIGATASSINVIIMNIDSHTWDIIWPANVNLIYAGFREGDKVTLSGIGNGDFNIQKFRANNTLRITKIEDTLSPGTGELDMSLSSEEIKSILLNKNDPNYASFINREVVIYRGYFVNGGLVGSTPDQYGNQGPILLFRGIISNVSFSDDDGGIQVQWGLTNHWGDFQQVVGRITSDEFHRALDANGNPQPYSAIKPIYAYDKGFNHAETSVHILAHYTVMVDHTDVKVKKGWFLGIGASTKVTTTKVPEDRTSQLDVQLEAKSIPVLYGVRNLTGQAVFADTLLTTSSTIYVVYALCEGEIGGIYDVYLGGKSLVCNNEADYNIRSLNSLSTQTDVVCRGRADRGDVLGGITSVDPNTVVDYYSDQGDVWNLPFNQNIQLNYNPYVAPPADVAASTTGRGVINGESMNIAYPQDVTIDVFSGTDYQKASSQLTDIASQVGFKFQNDYWKGKDTAEYWGPNHRLLDTAYLVLKVIINEGDTALPDLEFIVRGKVINCYNYDYSYAHDQAMSGESPNGFLLGDMVTLSTGQTVQIIDKWTFSRADGVLETRFRYSEPPNLNYSDGIPAITRFSMNKSGLTWTMLTFNYVLHSNTIPAEVATPITTIDESGDGYAITFPANSDIIIGGDFNHTSPFFSFRDSDGIVSNSIINGMHNNSSSLMTSIR